MEPQLISISEDYISIEELYDLCNAPGPCNQEMDCEGKIALVKGYIDYDNVFDQETYPQLPYEKFLIRDDNGGKSLEVWAVGADNSEIFDIIYHHRDSPERMVYIKGVVVGFDMPVMGPCHRGIKIHIQEARAISFE